MSGGPISLAVANARPQNIKIMLKSAEHDMKLLRNTDLTKSKGNSGLFIILTGHLLIILTKVKMSTKLH